MSGTTTKRPPRQSKTPEGLGVASSTPLLSQYASLRLLTTSFWIFEIIALVALLSNFRIPADPRPYPCQRLGKYFAMCPMLDHFRLLE